MSIASLMFIRLGVAFINAATGALMWRKPDPYSRPTLWRRAFVTVMVHLGAVFVRVGCALP